MPEQNPNQTQHTRETHAAKRQNADARRKAAEQEVDASHKVRDEQVAAHQERAANAQPTPTQREVDLAKLGVPQPEKEDDGSGEDLAMVRSVQPVQSGAAPYNTRDAAASPRQAPRAPEHRSGAVEPNKTTDK